MKCNKTVLELLENLFDDSEFRQFVRIVMDNLVDSNVFIRSLVLSLEMMHYEDSAGNEMAEFGFYFNSLVLGSNPNISKASADIDNKISGTTDIVSKTGFLTDSWVQFLPSIQSNRAIELYKTNNKSARGGGKADIFGQKRSAPSSLMTSKKVNASSDSKNIFDTENIPYRCNLDFHEDRNLFQKTSHSQQQNQSSHSSTVSNGGLHRSITPSTLSTHTSSNPSSKQTKTQKTSYPGVYETFKDLRKSVDSFFKFGTKSPSAGSSSSSSGEDRKFSTNPIKIQKFGEDSSSKGDTIVEEDVDEFELFKTPPEPPRFATSKSSSTTLPEMSALKESGADLFKYSNDDGCLLANPLLESDSSADGGDSLQDSPRYVGKTDAKTKATSNAKVFIPSSLFRMSVFLVQEKVKILLRLISSVSLRTVNHENICCLNTTLLILLFEHQRCVRSLLYRIFLTAKLPFLF